MKVLLLSIFNRMMMSLYEEPGLCSIASYLRQHNHEVYMAKIRRIEDYDITPLLNFEPDIIGITVYDLNIEDAIKFCRSYRTYRKTWICFGGPLPSYYGYEILKEFDCVDFVVKGEGENTFLELIERIETGKSFVGVKGVLAKDGSNIIENDNRELIGDLDSLPDPARDTLNQHVWRVALISTARGCISNCSFCSANHIWKGWRCRSILRVLDEISQIQKNHNIHAFHIIDSSLDNPGGKNNRVHKIATGILENKLDITYFAYMRANFMRWTNNEQMDNLRKSGLCGVCLGIETGNESDLKLYNKNTNIQEINNAIRMFKKYDINIEAGFINFNPYSTLDTIQKNIDFLHENRMAANIHHLISIYLMYEGTAMYNRLLRENLVLEKKPGACRFQFLNKDVGRLYNQLTTWFWSNQDFTRNCSKITYYVSKHPSVLSHYKLWFARIGDDKALNIVHKYETNLNDTIHIINEEMTSMIHHLIQNLSCDDSDIKAQKITNHFGPHTFFSKLVDTFDKNRTRLSKDLLKCNTNHEQYFLEYF